MHDHIFPLNLNGGPQSALNDSFHMGDAIMNYSDYLQTVKAEREKNNNNSNKKGSKTEDRSQIDEKEQAHSTLTTLSGHRECSTNAYKCQRSFCLTLALSSA